MIGATLELPLWFRWEQFEKIERKHRTILTRSTLWLLTDCVAFLSLITCSEAVGFWAQEWSHTWFSLGFGPTTIKPDSKQHMCDKAFIVSFCSPSVVKHHPPPSSNVYLLHPFYQVCIRPDLLDLEQLGFNGRKCVLQSKDILVCSLEVQMAMSKKHLMYWRLKLFMMYICSKLLT